MVEGFLWRLRITDPWVCTTSTITLRTADSAGESVVPVPGDEADVYRIEFDTVSRAFESGDPLPFELDDAVAQATVLEAVLRSARSSSEVKV